MNQVPDMPEVIRRIALSSDRQLAWQFFVFFSRFEYALKRCPQYLKENAGAHWDRFAEDQNPAFDPGGSPELTAAIDYFKSTPPMKQTKTNGLLDWASPTPYNNEKLLPWLLMQVRRVRNNLFHGGKFPGFPINEPSRDRELIGNAIAILGACLNLDQSVKARFLEGIED